MNTFLWMSREEGQAKGGIDVSSYGGGSYRRFSPFSHSPAYNIPVPGQEHLRANSVEGIWQGLKVVNGETEPSLFKGKPHKRAGKVEGHKFGDRVLGYVDARKKVYVPAYTYHVINNALMGAQADLEDRMQQGPVILYDVDKTSNNIEDTSKSYSHAALLADILNVLKDSPLPPFSKRRFTYMDESLEATLAYRQTLDDSNRKLLDEIMTFAYLFSTSELQRSFALQAIRKAGIETAHRLDSFVPTAKTAESYAAALTR